MQSNSIPIRRVSGYSSHIKFRTCLVFSYLCFQYVFMLWETFLSTTRHLSPIYFCSYHEKLICICMQTIKSIRVKAFGSAILSNRLKYDKSRTIFHIPGAWRKCNTSSRNRPEYTNQDWVSNVPKITKISLQSTLPSLLQCWWSVFLDLSPPSLSPTNIFLTPLAPLSVYSNMNIPSPQTPWLHPSMTSRFLRSRSVLSENQEAHKCTNSYCNHNPAIICHKQQPTISLEHIHAENSYGNLHQH